MALLAIVMFFVFMILPPLAVVYLFQFKRRGRRNPLTSQMLRAPGESISQRIEELNEKIDSDLISLMVGELMLGASCLFILQKTENATFLLWLSILGMSLYGIYHSYRLYQALNQRHIERLGLDGERAVGQELNQLMRHGYYVFHDFIAENFNIDHIVIGENGVFAVETKARSKPDRGRGAEDVKVKYDGQALRFPLWSEKEPLEQVRNQAVWLSEWLSKAVGARVVVTPVLALPGWYVERQCKDLLIFNGKNPQYLQKINGNTMLSAEMIQRVLHQIEQRCRDVAPRAYRKPSK